MSSPGLGQPPPIMFGIVDRVKLNHVLFGVSFLGWFNPCRKIELRTLEEVQPIGELGCCESGMAERSH